jgi:hypothetical protein
MSQDPFFERLKKLDTAHRLALSWPALTFPLRFASHAAYRILELALGRRHPHGRVVHQARRLREAGPGPLTCPEPKRVLFFTVRGWFIHASTEAVLAKALELRGARVSFFLCGGILDQCDFKPGTDPRVTRPLCWRCTGFAERLLAAFDLPTLRLRDLVGRPSRERARQLVAGKDRDQLERLTYQGLPLFELVQASVQRSLLRGDIGADPFSERVLRGFLESAAVLVDAGQELLRRERPQVVVMTNGLFFAEAILLALARREGIAVVTYERGMPLSTVLFDHNQPAIRFDLDQPWQQGRDRPLAATEERELDEYLETRARGQVGVIDLWPAMERGRGALAERLGLAPERPTAVLYTNILWDSAVFGRDVGFDGMFDWVAESVRLFAATRSRDLVIRVHPSEVRIPMSESRDRVIDRLRALFPDLPTNVRVVPPEDPASSYTLMGLADAVLVYTSTIGLEAAVRGRPVVVAGRTHYRGRGFTFDPRDREGYAADVAHALACKHLPPGEVEIARRYAHLFFFRFMQPFPWVVDTPRAARRLTFEHLDDLAPGRDPTLDRLCRGILEGEPFVSTPAAAGPPEGEGRLG